jgi:hypothetical protein
MKEFEDPFLDTPEVKLQRMLLERGKDREVLRQLSENEVPRENERLVDIGMTKVAVDQKQAESIADELKNMLGGFPRLNPRQMPAFGEGPSYIEAGAILGSQRTALVLFAVGEALDFWQVVTPKKMFGDAIDENLAREMMGMGYITIERKI